MSGKTLIPKAANKSSEARLDISARGVWTTGQRSFFDPRVFNQFARRYSGLTLSQAYKTNDNEKKRHYNDHVMSVDHGTFTPLVFSSSGGMAPECFVFYQKLYSVVASWVKTKLSFALLRSAVLCIRGNHHPFYKPLIADTGDINYEIHCSNIKDE